jgi:hypothetical protein
LAGDFFAGALFLAAAFTGFFAALFAAFADFNFVLAGFAAGFFAGAFLTALAGAFEAAFFAGTAFFAGALAAGFA